MSAIFFALVAYLGFGTGDVFGTAAARKIGGYLTTFWFSVLQVFIFIPLCVIFFENLTKITPGIITLNLFLGVLGAIGLIGFYEGLKIANASIVGTVSASFVVITVILSTAFFKERINQEQLIAIATIFTGLIITTLDLSQIRNRKFYLNKGVMLSFIPMVTWGFYWAFIKIPVERLGWFWPGYISTLCSFSVLLALLKVKKIQIKKTDFKGAFVPLFTNALLLGIGALSLNYAIETGLTAIVTPIAGSYPTLFAILAYLVFRDPIRKIEAVGILVTLIGIVMLSAYSV